ncbi:MAG: hypothetical protein ACYDDB_03535 [bacterium]
MEKEIELKFEISAENFKRLKKIAAKKRLRHRQDFKKNYDGRHKKLFRRGQKNCGRKSRRIKFFGEV